MSTNLCQTSGKKKNLTHNKKLQRECTVSTENYYKHNTEYNRLKQMDIGTFTFANSDSVTYRTFDLNTITNKGHER